MGTADRILAEYRQSKRRFSAAVSAVELLSAEQRKELIAVLLDRVEAETRAPKVVAPNTVASSELVRSRRVEIEPTKPRRKKTDRAEALVLERPGMTTTEIAPLLEQNRPSADASLRQVAKLRHTIERRNGRWYPVTPGGSAPVN